MLDDLDSIYRSARCAELRKRLPRLPSEYFARNCFIGASFMSRTECEMRRNTGMDKLMWGSDYPHTEGVWPWVNEGLRWTFNGLDRTEATKMLSGNAIECYGFDAAKLRRKADKVGPKLRDIVDAPLAAPPKAPKVEFTWAFRMRNWD